MPSIFTHTAVPLAIGLGLGAATVSRRLLVAGLLVAMLPDADVAGLRLGVAYAHEMGHRGASHSLTVALALGLLAWVAAPLLNGRRGVAFGFIAVSAASHALLDMCTTGGMGVGLWWPWSDQRVFFAAPARVIEVAPIGFKTLFSQRSLVILTSELLWVWLPCAVAALLMGLGRWSARGSAGGRGA